MEEPHIRIRHPNEILRQAKHAKKQTNRVAYANGIVIEWITNHFLASVILFDVAFIVPLLVINAPSNIKITLGVISGSWIQWWALPALQRSQNRQQAQADAKADADHEALTFMANNQQKILLEVEAIKKELDKS
ncbi:MAG TPA: hypothetical protein VLG27_02310 [Candidatus Saccharimonadia bacterium]|nr:hypothetical protein [Candidatus Saccharimonadia bacterium]